ncbi:MAG TPA: response regulator transcription factor [Methylomirabilota bacterium]|nr:response regulator transcription factor [Methylomirabilota bacterium]
MERRNIDPGTAAGRAGARNRAADDRGPTGRHVPAPAPEHMPIPGPQPGDGVIRVLVVDDHDLMRRALVGLLAAQDDMEVVAEAADGASAIRAARRLRPDVVVMDVKMPGMSGAEATSTILAELPEIAIVVLSMCDESVCGAVMARAGAAAYVEKSRPPSQLLESIRALV